MINVLKSKHEKTLDDLKTEHERQIHKLKGEISGLNQRIDQMINDHSKNTNDKDSLRKKELDDIIKNSEAKITELTIKYDTERIGLIKEYEAKLAKLNTDLTAKYEKLIEELKQKEQLMVNMCNIRSTA
jgi:hypothetical protein